MLGYVQQGENDHTSLAEHVVLIKNIPCSPSSFVTVRIQSKCLTSEVFHSRLCDCRNQLHAAMGIIQQRNEGIVIYLDQEGRGIGLINKLRAYALQSDGSFDTITANHKLGFGTDLRDFTVACAILEDLGVSNIRLLTNNPDKLTALENYGFNVVREPLVIEVPFEAANYIQTKIEKLGHFATGDGTSDSLSK